MTRSVVSVCVLNFFTSSLPYAWFETQTVFFYDPVRRVRVFNFFTSPLAYAWFQTQTVFLVSAGKVTGGSLRPGPSCPCF